MRTKLAHVCIDSNDLDATEAFYRVLGLEEPPNAYSGFNVVNRLLLSFAVSL